MSDTSHLYQQNLSEDLTRPVGEGSGSDSNSDSGSSDIPTPRLRN